MKEKIFTFLRNFFQGYLLYLDISVSVLLVLGLMLYLLDFQSGTIVLTVTAVIICVYHVLNFGYLVRYAEQKSSLEQFITMMMGFSVALIALGGVAKISGVTEKDKLLNIGLVISIGCSVIVLVYYILKSEQLRFREVPFIRNGIALVIGIGFFLVPLNTPRQSGKLETPLLYKEPVLKEARENDKTPNQIDLPAIQEETNDDTIN